MHLSPSGNLFLYIFFLLPWTVFLKVIAHKLVCGLSCPIPLVATITKQPLFSYSRIDFLITACFVQLWLGSSPFFSVYFFFFSALAVTIHTDIKHMLISRFMSLYLVPVAVFLSYMNYLPISALQSAASAVAAYFFLYAINNIFYLIKKHDGLGQGDLELLAFIGSFTGFLGCWFAILFGSVLGTLAGCLYMLWSRKAVSMLPFGPFLAIGAMLFVLSEQWIVAFIS